MTPVPTLDSSNRRPSGSTSARAAGRTSGIASGIAPARDLMPTRPWWKMTTLPNTIAIAVLGVLWIGLPYVSSGYWLQLVTTAAIHAVVALGLVVLIGKVGMTSLGQVALLGVAAWFALRIGQHADLPFPVLLVVVGLITAVIGVLIGLPALRLDGLYLALITLMGAAGVTLVLQLINFPNGGDGLLGFDSSQSTSATLARPEIATSTEDFFRYVLLVVGLVFLLVTLHVRGKPGRAWAAIKQSQSAAIATGINVTLYKLWAFALAAFITGVAGTLLAASAGGVTIYQFPVQQSIILVASVLFAGAGSYWGAVLAAVFMQVMPGVMNLLNVPTQLLTILFGIGVIQVLLTSQGGVTEQFPKDMKRLGRFIRRKVRGSSCSEASTGGAA